ncbi:hydroxyacid dehydrogenase [Candidatus Woesearchaeota archaeon]|nr:hydroxyacid dehydrogenase [Candidatus Woesearchaeota archaeon]
MVNIIFTEVEDWAKEYIKNKLATHTIEFIDGILTEKNATKAKNAEILAPFVGSTINEKVITAIPQLRLIATQSTGFDHIDVKEAQRKGITVSNVPAYGDNTVAQHAWALVLCISKKIIEGVQSTKKGNFNPVPYRGFDLKNKTIGVIGTGRIGISLIRQAKGFDMNVLAYDVFKNEKASQELGFPYVELDELFTKSDIISIHVPLLPTTKHLINKETLKKLKQGVVIINTSRGGIIQTSALIEGIKQGIIGAAGLDVLEIEHEIKNHKIPKTGSELINEINELLTLPNVYVTPHNAYNTKEAILRIIDTTIDNINAFLAGKTQNSVKG